MKTPKSYDIELDLATAHSRMATKWRNRKWKWGEFAERCRQTKRTDETVGEYMRMSKEEQSAVKDVGGFVGGYLADGERKTGSVRFRSCATLDIDYGTPGVWEDFTLAYGCAAIMYSTHKHTAESPRFRLVIPFSRNVSPSEYEPVCRRIAETVGMDLFDGTTYQTARLFYWPSTPKDGEYVFREQEGPPLDVDSVLASYVNPADASEWPIGSREGDVVAREMRKAGAPGEKPGVIGAFCRAYTIEEAIAKFLPDVYEPTAHEGRYTYRQGSVAGGLVCYGGEFAYSHHSTDPAGGRLCNAFDLCRIHLYGIHDEGKRIEDVTRLPSYSMMQGFAAADANVRILLARERRESAVADFAGLGDEAAHDGADDWFALLERDKHGNAKSTAANIMAVLENDPLLKGRLWHDDFSGFDMVDGGLPWDPSATQWGNRDDANLRVYLENVYGITGKDKIKDVREAVLTKRRRHPIKEYLLGLKWDGTPRLDRLIIDYIGAEDNELTRAMTRKQFVAAVARVMRPGCKYDYCLTLTGPEGIGKSTALSVMGGEWFSDSLSTTEGKEGMEQLRRSWIIEIGELASLKRADVEQVKNYLTRRDDIYRPAYGSVVERHPRQCVFFGTTNEDFFLKGDNGNRRFWVVRVNEELRSHSDWMGDLKRDRDQLWAEAVHLFRQGEPLYLSAGLEAEARQRQREFNDNSDDPLLDMLQQFLDTPLPADWEARDLNSRRSYINDSDELEAAGIAARDRFCIAEFMCERLGRNMADKEYKYMARKVGKLMDTLPGWEKMANMTGHAAKIYGRQKGYQRISVIDSKNDTEDDI